jgi:hypothetical protein
MITLASIPVQPGPSLYRAASLISSLPAASFTSNLRFLPGQAYETSQSKSATASLAQLGQIRPSLVGSIIPARFASVLTTGPLVRPRFPLATGDRTTMRRLKRGRNTVSETPRAPTERKSPNPHFETPQGVGVGNLDSLRSGWCLSACGRVWCFQPFRVQVGRVSERCGEEVWRACCLRLG